MTHVRFRQAEPADAGTILRIKRAAIRDLAGWEYDAEQIEAWAPEAGALPAFEAAIDADRFTVLLAEMDSTVAGYGVLNGAEGRIDAAYVRPEFAREGIATSLISQLETRARMRDIGSLTTVASLNAEPFYESLGYRTFAGRTRTIEGVDLEFVAMRKSLDAAETD